MSKVETKVLSDLERSEELKLYKSHFKTDCLLAQSCLKTLELYQRFQIKAVPLISRGILLLYTHLKRASNIAFQRLLWVFHADKVLKLTFPKLC